MKYIYDIYLNFQKKLYEFYDWNKNDKIYHIRRIPAIKVDYKTLKDIILNDVEFILDNLDLENKCEYYEGKSIKKFKFCFLITDGKNIISININDKEVLKSKLLLFEEDDVARELKGLDKIKLEYKIIKKIDDMTSLTRKENKIYINIIEYIDNLYKNKEMEKIKYLYYECFNIKEDDMKKIVSEFKYNLTNNFSVFGPKIYDFYKITKITK